MFADRSVHRLFLIAAVLVCLARLTGCATVVHGTHQNVKVKSNPPNATVYLDGKQVGHTPMTAGVSRHAHQTIKLTHDGYRPYIVHFQHHVSTVTGGNFLVGGILGAAADAADGANGYQTPKKLDVAMVALAAGTTQAEAKPVIFNAGKASGGQKSGGSQAERDTNKSAASSASKTGAMDSASS